MQFSPALLLPVLLLLGVGACSKSHDHAASAASEPASHAHHAPHGGTLVPLGQHLYNLEFVQDATVGKLTAYLLDAHAENFIRGPLAAINLTVETNGPSKPITLFAVANSATGETVGDTSEYSAQADWLKGAATPLKIVIPVLTIRETTFKDVSATIEPAAAQ